MSILKGVSKFERFEFHGIMSIMSHGILHVRKLKVYRENFSESCNLKKLPNSLVVKRLTEKFVRIDSVVKNKSSGRPRSGRPIRNIALVTAGIGEIPSTFRQAVCREF